MNKTGILSSLLERTQYIPLLKALKENDET
jgi:hypothetical protein